jgi:hypothetical protein
MLIYLVKNNTIEKFEIIKISDIFERNSTRYKEYTYWNGNINVNIIIPIISNYVIDSQDGQIVYFYLNYNQAKKMISKHKISIFNRIKKYIKNLLQ